MTLNVSLPNNSLSSLTPAIVTIPLIIAVMIRGQNQKALLQEKLTVALMLLSV